MELDQRVAGLETRLSDTESRLSRTEVIAERVSLIEPKIDKLVDAVGELSKQVAVNSVKVYFLVSIVAAAASAAVSLISQAIL